MSGTARTSKIRYMRSPWVECGDRNSCVPQTIQIFVELSLDCESGPCVYVVLIFAIRAGALADKDDLLGGCLLIRW